MTSLMNEMISEASQAAQVDGYGFAHRNIEAGTLKCRVLMVNTNSMNGAQKIWWLNEKRIAASKVIGL